MKRTANGEISGKGKLTEAPRGQRKRISLDFPRIAPADAIRIYQATYEGEPVLTVFYGRQRTDEALTVEGAAQENRAALASVLGIRQRSAAPNDRKGNIPGVASAPTIVK